MKSLIQKLQLCTSTLALIGAGAMMAARAHAQEPGSDIEQVVVTGSSIRGVQVVGSTMTTVTSADIERSGAQSLMDVVRTVPALSDMGGQPVGNLGNNYFSPNIHQLGHSASKPCRSMRGPPMPRALSAGHRDFRPSSSKAASTRCIHPSPDWNVSAMIPGCRLRQGEWAAAPMSRNPMLRHLPSPSSSYRRSWAGDRQG